MNRLFLITCLVFFTAVNLYSQDCTDTVKIRCWYTQYGAMDTANIKMKNKDIMLLDVGSVMSKYYTYGAYYLDSLRGKTDLDGLSEEQIQKIVMNNVMQAPRSSRTHDYIIMKNCPKNKLNLIDRLGLDTYYYEEDIPVFDWKLTEDTMTVCGYMCKNAHTTFRGRTYNAWYAPQIPISSGPWKFAGLPGLILRVQDSQKMFYFICTQIITPPKTTLIESQYDYLRAIKVSKSKYNQNKQRYMDNSEAFMSGNPIVQQNVPAHNYEKRPFNPIELTEK